MGFELPKIIKTAEEMLRQVELAVLRFPRRHKYQTGADLREQAMAVARLTHRAWRDVHERRERIKQLAEAIDNLKLTIQLGKQVEAFASFGQFEMLARIAADLGRQCGGWLKQQRLNGQNGSSARTDKSSIQRPEILSARAASATEANR